MPLYQGVQSGGAVTNDGTFAVQEDGASLTALQLIDNAVSGAGFNITQMGGAAVPIGAGTEATAVRVTFPTDGTGQVAVTGTVTVDGSGVTQPVSGTVTANLSATDNAVLDTIDAVLDTINAKLVTGTVIGDVNLGATDNAVLDSIVTSLAKIEPQAVDEYETVAASQTDQVIGPTGATGDYLKHVLVIPATVSPGVVTVKDNTTAVVSFPGGTDSLLTLHPFVIPVEAASTSGAWKITTGANVSVFAVGNFT